MIDCPPAFVEKIQTKHPAKFSVFALGLGSFFNKNKNLG